MRTRHSWRNWLARIPSHWYLGTVLVMVVAVMAGHYLTWTGPAGHDSHQGLATRMHDVYRRLVYVPVVLAAARWGLRGGLLISLLGCALYLPHVVLDWGGDLFGLNLNRTLEMALYVVVGALVGLYADIRRDHVVALRETMTRMVRLERDLASSERLRAIGLMAAELAHEVRNPLGSLQGIAELLGSAAAGDSRSDELVRLHREEIDRLENAVRNFIDLARDSKQDPAARLEPGRPAAALEHVHDLLRRRYDADHVALRIDVAAESRGAATPLASEHLRQVTLNLLLNAKEAAGPGGTVDVRVFREGGRVVTEVDDSGPGLRDADAGRLFEPFFTTRTGGTGLGLTISRRIVESVEGSLTLFNRSGGGARARLELPLAEDQARAEPRETDGEPT